MSEDRLSLFLYGQAADELRRQELERLKAATIPTLEALRALQPEELHTEVAGMLERLGYTHEATTPAGDIILTKDDRKFVVAVARRSDIEPIQARKSRQQGARPADGCRHALGGPETREMASHLAGTIRLSLSAG